MKVKCPYCDSKNVYVYDEEWTGSIENEDFYYSALIHCEDCNHGRRIYFDGKIKIHERHLDKDYVD